MHGTSSRDVASHQILISTIIGLTPELIGEARTQGNPLIGDRGGEAPVDVGDRCAGEVLLGLQPILGVGSPLLVVDPWFAGILFLVEAVHRTSVGRVYPEVLIEVIFVAATSLHVLVVGRLDTIISVGIW